MEIKKVLTIAGTDPTGGAGIQADIKTMTMNGVYAMSVITAMVAQNTTGVYAIQESTSSFLKKQLEVVFEDIYPDAIKIGMVSSIELIEVIFEVLNKYKVKNVVVDPVMIATAGSSLINNNALQVMTDKLFPLATLITPNILEAEVLANMEIKNKEDMEIAAKYISNKYNCATLIKGGHSINDANDVLYTNKIEWFNSKRIDNPNSHGTGCTLSSAIASNLAKGYSLQESITLAKEYLSNALKANLNLGKGSGPLLHNYKVA